MATGTSLEGQDILGNSSFTPLQSGNSAVQTCGPLCRQRVTLRAVPPSSSAPLRLRAMSTWTHVHCPLVPCPVPHLCELLFTEQNRQNRSQHFLGSQTEGGSSSETRAGEWEEWGREIRASEGVKHCPCLCETGQAQDSEQRAQGLLLCVCALSDVCCMWL